MKQGTVLLLLCASVAACAADLHKEHYGNYKDVFNGYSGHAMGLMGHWGSRYARPFLPHGLVNKPGRLSYEQRHRMKQYQFQTQAIAVIKLLSGGIVTPFGKFTATFVISKNQTTSQSQSQGMDGNESTKNGSSVHRDDTDLGSDTATAEVKQLKHGSQVREDIPDEVASEEREDGARDSASEERAEVAQSPTSEEREDVARDTAGEEGSDQAKHRAVEEREDVAREAASEEREDVAHDTSEER